MESVDLVASGYEWICPNCEKLNREIEVTATVECRRTWWEETYCEKNEIYEDASEDEFRSGCGEVYETDIPEHAYS